MRRRSSSNSQHRFSDHRHNHDRRQTFSRSQQHHSPPRRLTRDRPNYSRNSRDSAFNINAPPNERRERHDSLDKRRNQSRSSDPVQLLSLLSAASALPRTGTLVNNAPNLLSALNQDNQHNALASLVTSVVNTAVLAEVLRSSQAGPIDQPRSSRNSAPAADDRPTSTIFLGNLDKNVSINRLRSIFEQYGIVEDIDAKYPQSGNPYAFVRFTNPDMAVRAKEALQGSTIGRNRCKLGFGKACPSPCLWIGGLGPWLSFREFSNIVEQFARAERLVWTEGKSYAYALFRNTSEASRVANQLHGYPAGGSSRTLRVDFTDESYLRNDPIKRFNAEKKRASATVHDARDILAKRARASSETDLSALEEVWRGDVKLKHWNFSCQLRFLAGDMELARRHLGSHRTAGRQTTVHRGEPRTPPEEGEYWDSDEGGRRASPVAPRSLCVSQRVKFDSSSLAEARQCVLDERFALLVTLEAPQASRDGRQASIDEDDRPLGHMAEYLASKGAAGLVNLRGSPSLLYLLPPGPFTSGLIDDLVAAKRLRRDAATVLEERPLVLLVEERRAD